MEVSNVSVGQIVTAVVGRADAGRTVVSLDGRAGAGKSTLAAAVAASLEGVHDVAVVHGDDFFRPLSPAERLAMRPQDGYGQLFAWRRLRDQALVPLSEGRPAHYAPYDPATNSLCYGAPRTVPPAQVVIVEGTLTARPELAAFYHLTVFVDTPSQECLRRLLARGRGPAREAWIVCWRAVEEHYLATTDVRARADLTVTGV
ncbi:hypothetical protein [Streptomyces sp. NPDC001851]|uniref:uridine kinase family protein n=1 Tax=Streptomyces sp. NPDC001851 TaxID=3154529 RepID=UPI003327EC36